MKQARGILNVLLLTLVAAGTVVLVVFLAGRNGSSPDEYKAPALFAMDTTFEVTIQGKPEDEAEADAEAAFELVKEIESLTSRFAPGSDVARINAAAGKEAVEVNPRTIQIIQESLEISRRSGGAFDITIAPLVELWGFYDKDYRVPSGEEIEDVLDAVGYSLVLVDEQAGTVSLTDERVEIDLGGVAKGYAVREAFELLEERGVEHGLVNFGGTVGAIGTRADGERWVIGIRDPRGEATDLAGDLRLADGFVASSGDYERFFTENGTRYCHIFDPSTGYQPRQLTGVTVAGSDPVTADLLSTAVFIMGTDSGFELVDGLGGFEALAIDSDGEVLMTGGMEEDYSVRMR